MLSLALTLLLSTPDAQAAGKCDALVKKAEAAKGTDLATAFTNLAGCDHKLAEDSYMKLLSNAADSDALVAYSLAAIKLDIWNPVWGELSKIPDYSARDEVASRVGAACATEPKVTAFLQGAYFGLRDIEFSQWDDAFAACENTSLSDWLTTQVSAPPEKLYDEKFNALMGIYVNKQRAAALPVLSKAAVKAAKAGPFDAILQQMDAAVAPSLGETLSEEDKAALEKALIEVAKGVDPEKAKLVADRLATAGAEKAAAKLLPAIYPKLVQGGGSFLYGVAAVEAGDCKGKKTAVVHHAVVTEPGKRWNVITDAEPAIRTAAKPKLTKCTAEEKDWPVSVTPTPIAGAKNMEGWLNSLSKQLTEKGYEVELEEEKDVKLN